MTQCERLFEAGNDFGAVRLVETVFQGFMQQRKIRRPQGLQ